MKYSIGILVDCVTVGCGVTTASAADQSAEKATIEKVVVSYTTARVTRIPTATHPDTRIGATRLLLAVGLGQR